MKYFEIKPQSTLAGFVKCFWYLEKDYTNFKTALEPVWPDGCIDLIFHFGNGLHLLNNGEQIKQPTGFVIGLQDHPLVFWGKGKERLIGIRFYAYGLSPFVDCALKELADQITDSNLLFNKMSAELAEKMAEAILLDNFKELEKFLIQRLKVSRDIAQVKAATDSLFQSQGVIRIDHLAHSVNLSRRSLERKFMTVVGYSPKTLARVIRFNYVKNALMLEPQQNLTQMAYRHSYSDQAHFIKEFKQFSGQNPGAFAENVVNGQIRFYR